jgi:hypothetical protein
MMHPDVEWPNGMEGGFIHGREAVRAYWTRQWGMIVDVHQVVRDRAGTIVTDQMVQHVYDIENGLIRRMEIRK